MPDSLTPALLKFRDEFSDFLLEHLDSSEEEFRELSLERDYYRMAQPIELGGRASSAMEMLIARETIAKSGIVYPGAIIGPEPGLLSKVDGLLKSDYLIALLRG